jgi:hypothetical protein
MPAVGIGRVEENKTISKIVGLFLYIPSALQ